jgi:minor histocompatibility antigen H13
MESVAKAFDAPVKVIWPRGDSFSLLGLGDIVIPGVFIALMLRFDRYLAKKRGTTNQRLYFHVAFVSYIASLITTVLVLHVFKHGQPALLYIVPYLIISVLLIAMVKGDLGELLAYNEEQKSEEEKKAH